MRRRTLALTAASAVVVAMTVLPSIGAAAAEPLGDGAYSFDVAGESVEVVVTAGNASHVAPEGFEVSFPQDADDLVLNVGVVSVAGDLGTVAYDVVIDVGEVDADGDGQLDYVVTVVQSSDDPPLDEGGEEPVSEGTEDDGGAEESVADVTEEPVAEETEDGDEAGTDDETVQTDHGAIVSMVAQCAPRGRDAREAELPNHGFFVRAAARGETVTWTVADGTDDGSLVEANLSTLAGATTFCATVTSDDGEDVVAEDVVLDEQAMTGQEPTLEDDGSADVEDSDGAGGPPEGVGRGKGRGGPPEGVGHDRGRGGPPEGVPARGPRD